MDTINVEISQCTNTTVHAQVKECDQAIEEKIAGITNNPCKNKHHTQSDGSDWHP
jgi:hypothetical protein